jgi:ribitol-5-phosphate 2-dehydrogenase (NADP+) / D-ribitol-5-phosphate cytidylyltransferase
MSRRPRTVAVVLAGGTGARIGLTIPKQLIEIGGKPILEHTLDVFSAAEAIDDVLLLMHPAHLATAERISSKYPRISRVIAGGDTRNDSTRNALIALADLVADGEDPYVLFHDAVRPLVDARIIDDVVTALDSYDAVDVAIPSADTIIEVDENNVIVAVPDRSRLRRGQTPQAFRLSTITAAYELAWQDPAFAATDDCSVVLRYLPDVPIVVVEGSEANLKVTQPLDIVIADRLFRLGESGSLDAASLLAAL